MSVNSEESVNSQQLSVTSEQKPQEEESQASSPESQASLLTPQVSQKTQGVRPLRDRGASALQSAAKKAARSNSRSDVHEYMRLRRLYV